MPQGTYTEWRWPPSTSFARTLLAGYNSFEHVLVPEIDPGPESTYFWAHQFRLIGGEGGYIGLQTKGNRVDGSLGKMAILSIWNAEEAAGPGTTRFDGEGTGWSCRIPYQWQAGRAYGLKVATVGGGQGARRGDRRGRRDRRHPGARPLAEPRLVVGHVDRVLRPAAQLVQRSGLLQRDLPDADGQQRRG